MTDTSGKHVFWDWNGTILDDAEVVLSCVNFSLGRYACPPLTMEAFRAVQVDTLRDFYRDVGVPEDRIDHALESERDLFHDTYEPRADHAALRVGASDVLRRLNKAAVSNVILSNHIADQIVRLLDRHAIRTCFDAVLAYVSRATQFREATKKERFCLYRDDHRVDPSQTMIIGDTQEEIDIAHEYGLGSIAITGGLASEERLRAAKPDYLVHSFDEMACALEERGFLP